MMANAAARRSRMERSLAAMESLGRHLAGIPGRKNVVWIGGGFSMFSLTGSLGMGAHGGAEDFEAKVRQTSQRLAQQGVVLYIVDSKGIEMPPDTSAAYRAPLPVRGRGRFEPQMDAENISNDPRSAMGLMASVTGGRYLYNTNDLTAGFKQTVADLRGTYTLGFYAPEEPDNKWHKLKVRVSRSGVNVRHREGYLADAASPQPVEWSDEMWRAAISNPLGSSAIPLTANCEAAPAGELVLSLTIDANSVHFYPDGEDLKADLQIAVADRTQDGYGRPHLTKITASVPASKWQDARAHGVPYGRQWKPGSDVTAARVVVRDMRTGQYGTLDVPLSGLSNRQTR
jgi:hypothetical protein